MGDSPTFTFCIPTHRADRPLKRCLDSLAVQLGNDDEVIVVGDTLDGPLPSVEKMVENYGTRYRYFEHNTGVHDYGHAQLNAAIAAATKTWLHCSDDDDVWTPGAIPIMRQAVSESDGHPLLFRFLSYHGHLVWEQRGFFAEHHIGGHCLVCPNIPEKLGKWASHYQGDWSYVSETVALHGGIENVIWRDEIIVVARP